MDVLEASGEKNVTDGGADRSVASPLLIEAKLQVPVVRPEAIERPALVDWLSDHAVRRVLTVVAPAGYGKTTAVAGWLASRPMDVAWMTCDRDDCDPVRFLSHLLAAIARSAPDVTEAAERALSGGARLGEEVVPLLANALFGLGERRLVLVLDDVHLVDGSPTPGLVERLIEFAPTLAVVLLGRRPLALPIARWTSAGQAATLDPERLRFDSAETERFLNDSMRLGLSPRELALIEERIEGWAAGLSLVATSLGGGASRPGLVQMLHGTSGSIAEYLVHETLGALDRPAREFMLRSSILRRLSPDVCAAVLGEHGTEELIEEVRRSNLLIADVDDDGEWFRYHQLLSDVLRSQLRRRSPDLIAELHRRASSWFEGAGFAAEAIEHALDAGDGERAARLLSDHWLTLFHARGGRTVARILDRLPDDVGDYGPAMQAIALFGRSLASGTADVWQQEDELERVEREHDPPGLARVIDAGLLTPYHGDFRAAVARGPAALERAATASPVDRYILTVQYAAMLWLSGDREQAHTVLSRAVHAPGSTVTDIWRLWVRVGLALDDGDLDAALRHGERAVALVRSAAIRTVHARVPALRGYAWALLTAGRHAEAAALLDEAEATVSAAREPLHHLPNLILRAQLHLAREEWRDARAVATEARRLADRFTDVGIYQARLKDVEQSLARSVGVALGPEAVLTPGELRVLQLLAKGMSMAQIARELYLSPNTVRSHRRRLYRRLGADSRDEALRAARERALI